MIEIDKIEIDGKMVRTRLQYWRIRRRILKKISKYAAKVLFLEHRYPGIKILCEIAAIEEFIEDLQKLLK